MPGMRAFKRQTPSLADDTSVGGPVTPRDSQPGKTVRERACRTPSPPGPSLPSPEDEGRVEGLKSSPAGEKKGGRGSHEEKSGMRAGAGAGGGINPG